MDTGLVYVAPAPRRGHVVAGRDVAGRALRISSHPEHGRVVLSIWQDGHCIGTVRLAPQDVPDVVRSLTAAVVVPPEDVAAAG